MAAKPSKPTTQIIVQPGDVQGPISPLVFGFNENADHSFTGLYDPATNQVAPGAVADAKKLGVTIVRFPGGTPYNTYHFTRAIGPQDQRIAQINGDDGRPNDTQRPVSSVYGPDEHGAFVESIGAQIGLQLNWGTATAQEAADWVEYMTAPLGSNPGGGIDWAQRRADNGHPEPYDVAYVEIGNEIGAGAQGYWAWPNAGVPVDERCSGLADPADLATREIGEVTCHYVYGGSARITNQPVNTLTDERPPAAISSGTAGQKLYAKYPPVLPDDHVVSVDGLPWQAVDDLAGAGAENVYQLTDPASGEITFGDGTHGNIPAAGSLITMTYTSGPHDGFNEFYRKIKAVNPGMKVISALELRRQFQARTQPFLQQVGPLDGLEYHFATNDTDVAGYADRPIEEFYDEFVHEADKRAEELRQLQQSIQAIRGGGIPAYATEYGQYALPKKNGVDDQGFGFSMAKGISHADMLRNLITLGVPVGEHHTFTTMFYNNPGAGVPYVGLPGSVMLPRAVVHMQLREMTGTTLVGSSVKNNPTRTTFTGEQMDLLTVFASTDTDHNLYLTVINRDRELDITASVTPEDYHGHSAEVWATTGPNFLSENTPDSPNTVATTKQQLTVDPGNFTYTFGSHSVTTIKINWPG